MIKSLQIQASIPMATVWRHLVETWTINTSADMMKSICGIMWSYSIVWLEIKTKSNNTNVLSIIPNNLDSQLNSLDIHESNIGKKGEFVLKAYSSKTIDHWEFWVAILKTVVWTMLSVYDLLLERAELQQQNTDKLTWIGNFDTLRYFIWNENKLPEKVKEIVMVSLLNLGDLNSRFWIEIGDKVLKRMAETLSLVLEHHNSDENTVSAGVPFRISAWDFILLMNSIDDDIVKYIQAQIGNAVSDEISYVTKEPFKPNIFMTRALNESNLNDSVSLALSAFEMWKQMWVNYLAADDIEFIQA